MTIKSIGKATSRNAKSVEDRPKKPYADFPLSPHAGGKWQKKINGRTYYYGRWGSIVDGKMTRLRGDGWKDALALYNDVHEDDRAGRERRATLVNGTVIQLKTGTAALTVADLCNRFLTDKKRKLETGELTSRTVGEYKLTTDRLVKTFGKVRPLEDLGTNDFTCLRGDLATQFGPVRLGNEIQKVRTVFKYGIENGLIEKVVKFGSEFKKPNKRVLRQHKAKMGKKLFAADEVRKLIEVAPLPLKAMVLLGINCGFGNANCGTLPLTALNLELGWVEFPRPKTGIERRCPLWPETVTALREAIAERPTPKVEAAMGAVFVTKYGNPWASEGSATAVSHEFGKLLQQFDIKRWGVGFYTLKHTFRTVADATKDPNAIRTIMGHTDDANYTHGIGDERLQAVTGCVREWVFGATEGGTK